MLSLLISAFLLGLIFNAAPGTVFAETIRQGAKGGFRPALAVQLGSLVGDATWAILGLTGVGILLQLDSLRLPIGIAGIAYLLWLAWDAWRATNQEFSVRVDNIQARRQALKSGMTLSLTNPQNVAYWAALGSALGAVGVSDPKASDYAIFFAGFMISSILWSFFCAAMVARLFRNRNQTWIRFTYRACALAFLFLALGAARELLPSDDVKAVSDIQSPVPGLHYPAP